MKVILFRSNNIFDSRVNKYYSFYNKKKLNYTIVGWDRAGKGFKKEHYDFFQYKAGEAIGGIKAIMNHVRWMIFVYLYLKKHRDVTTIHACDLNSAFPSAIFKLLHKKNVELIFDACDWFSANFSKTKVLKFIFGCMERFTCRWADHLIICEPERKEQIQFKLKKEPLIMRNIPEIDITQITEVQDKYKFENNYPTIAYLGGFAEGRFLMELLTLVEKEHFNLLIAGSGNSAITQKCEELSKLDNVKYFGRLDMIEGLNMENAADIIYAMYCKVNPNHIYAAPNKYYEAMLLAKPLITTKGTSVGNKVKNFNTGWEIEEDIEELRVLIRTLNSSKIKEKGNKAFDLWNNQFKNDLLEFFENKYRKILK